ncbi:MAG: hypothetical protein GEU73_16955 [Chloroflexi bacterium]|nr:hypothetical protein [Chloroflexota bacterium]
MSWILLIYTIPSEPARLRVSIWRELKTVGAVYLRNGVCALPQREDTREAFWAVAAKVEALGGRATVAEGARLASDDEELVIQASRQARTEEYRDLAREAEALLDHVRRETEHRAFGKHELAQLAGDVGKLKRWGEQVRTRDHFSAPGSETIAALLRQCDDMVMGLLDLARGESWRVP